MLNFRIAVIMSVISLKGTFTGAQPFPRQPQEGPGGAEYLHKAVNFYDHATQADGYWLFEPADPKPDSAEVVVFMHGYGAYNPMAYGKWIKHLVAKGNIVIYPRYQYNLIFPRPNYFPLNTAKGIKDALALLNTGDHVRPNVENLTYIAHSYGGVIASNLGVSWEQYGLPKPAAMFLVQPGSGPFKGARLTDYSKLPSGLNLLVVVGEDDFVVGAEFGALIFNTAVNTPNRNFLIQRRDTTSSRHWILATHSEPYAYDLDFDTGVRNYTALRVLSTSRTDEVEFYCYWKLSDALIDYTRHGTNGNIAFGDTPEQRFMGYHHDGRPIKPLEVFLPDVKLKLMSRREAVR